MISNLCNLSHSQKLARFICSFSVAGWLWKGEHKADEVVPGSRQASALDKGPNPAVAGAQDTTPRSTASDVLHTSPSVEAR
jgi:hypothetical protein